MIPKLIYFFIPITCLPDVVMKMRREILCWSLMGRVGKRIFLLLNDAVYFNVYDKNTTVQM